MTRAQERVLDLLISAPAPGRWHSPRMRQMMLAGQLDDRNHLYDAQRHRFPAGLLPLVRDRLPGEVPKECPREEGPVRPPAPTSLRGVELQPWQLEPVQSALEHRRGVWWMPTGAGKTECGALLCWCLEGRLALWVVNTKDLLLQTVDRLGQRLGEKVGRWGAGQMEPGRITVATIQAIPYRERWAREYLARMQILILDEGHHSPARTWCGVARACTQASYRIAMTGTPFSKEDPLRNLLLMGAIGSRVLYRITADELAQKGWLARCRVLIQPWEGRENGLDWPAAYRRHLLDPLYNRAVVRRVAQWARQGHTCLVLTDRVHHGLTLRDALAGEDIPTAFCCGRDLPEWRRTHLDQLRCRRLRAIVATPIFDEGVDIPSLDVVALAGIGKSQRQTLQRIGRALRRKGGENVAHILDWEPRTNYYLLKHARLRQEIYADEGFEVVREEGSAK